MADVAPPPDLTGDPELQIGYLSYLRQSVADCLDGLDETQVRWSPVESGTSLLSLVAHLRMVESFWFGMVWEGSTAPFPPEEIADDEPASGVVDDYISRGARWDAMVSLVPDLGARVPALTRDDDVDMRWILLHLVEETARHAGHADIIRELIDGATGR